MQFIDSHCHLSHNTIKNQLANAHIQNVIGMINVSTTLESISTILDLTNTYENVYGTIGIHPLHKFYVPEQVIYDTIINNNHTNIVAIGETGLDLYKSNNLVQQSDMLVSHLSAAYETKLPVILHTRNADHEIKHFIDIAYKQNTRCILHSFTGSIELAKYAIDKGCAISISGIVTFKNALSLVQVVRALPIDSLLIETDAPYLTPVPYRGNINEPANVIFIARKISEIKDMPLEMVARSTYNNTIRFFPKLRYDYWV